MTLTVVACSDVVMADQFCAEIRFSCGVGCMTGDTVLVHIELWERQASRSRSVDLCSIKIVPNRQAIQHAEQAADLRLMLFGAGSNEASGPDMHQADQAPR